MNTHLRKKHRRKDNFDHGNSNLLIFDTYYEVEREYLKRKYLCIHRYGNEEEFSSHSNDRVQETFHRWVIIKIDNCQESESNVDLVVEKKDEFQQVKDN